jgi:hypothetical protein
MQLEIQLTILVIAPDRTRTVIRTFDEVVKIMLDRLYVDGTLLEQMQQRNAEICRLFARWANY